MLVNILSAKNHIPAGASPGKNLVSLEKSSGWDVAAGAGKSQCDHSKKRNYSPTPVSDREGPSVF